MEQSRTPNAITSNVIAMAATGATLTLTEATDTDSTSLREHFVDLTDVTWNELCRIGGLFSVHPANLLAGAS
jgi:hypothetical protein